MQSRICNPTSTGSSLLSPFSVNDFPKPNEFNNYVCPQADLNPPSLWIISKQTSPPHHWKPSFLCTRQNQDFLQFMIGPGASSIPNSTYQIPFTSNRCLEKDTATSVSSDLTALTTRRSKGKDTRYMTPQERSPRTHMWAVFASQSLIPSEIQRCEKQKPKISQSEIDVNKLYELDVLDSLRDGFGTSGCEV